MDWLKGFVKYAAPITDNVSGMCRLSEDVAMEC